jgi:NAD(P)-dependent dehydrogenase (short-subunit alcohol dehydrogenase family)
VIPEPVAVVTGGARGIGAAIAARWASFGMVVVGDLDESAGRELVAPWGDRAVFVKADATDEDDVAALMASVTQLGGRPSAVFANAGATGVVGSITTTSVRDFRATTDLLLTSVFLAFKHGALAMRPDGRGALVATTSVAGLRGGLGPHAYTAAKHAVTGLVRSVASEVAPWGLTVNAVAPGATVSSLSARLIAGDVDDLVVTHAQLAMRSASGVPTTADDIAETAVFLARSSGRINGSCVVVDGGDAMLGSSGRAYHRDPGESG